MKEFKGLVANNQVEEKLLDVANLANGMAKALDKMSESLAVLGKTRTYCINECVEVSENFKDLFHQLSEMIGKSSVNLDMESFIKYNILDEE
ncbi:hypothetical protein GKB13_08180 [Campylobacter coli]|nr:hypothetical protein [Campylobacter coli]